MLELFPSDRFNRQALIVYEVRISENSAQLRLTHGIIHTTGKH